MKLAIILDSIVAVGGFVLLMWAHILFDTPEGFRLAVDFIYGYVVTGTLITRWGRFRNER